MLPVVVFLRRQVQNQIGTQQQSRIGLGTQNLARHNVHQIGDTRSRSHVHALRERAGTSPFPGNSAPGNSAGDAQAVDLNSGAVDLNSGLLQGENTGLDSGKGRWSHVTRHRPPQHSKH